MHVAAPVTTDRLPGARVRRIEVGDASGIRTPGKAGVPGALVSPSPARYVTAEHDAMIATECMLPRRPLGGGADARRLTSLVEGRILIRRHAPELKQLDGGDRHAGVTEPRFARGKPGESDVDLVRRVTGVVPRQLVKGVGLFHGDGRC